jgi:antitoxin VapB
MYIHWMSKRAPKTTRAFKSGNSIAVRLPASFGVQPGTEMRVREEQGRYIVEPVEEAAAPGKIDLTGIAGACPGWAPPTRDEREFEETRRPWRLLDGKSD